jgi:hypothetical protein
MQASEKIPLARANSVLDAAFADSAQVWEADSKVDQAILCFPSRAALAAYIQTERDLGKKSVNLAAHYPEALGRVLTTTVTLRPELYTGASWRESVAGWGLIQLQLEFEAGDTVAFRIAVNTEKRANAWAGTYPELGAPSLWNWKVVQKHARRLIRVLRSGA